MSAKYNLYFKYHRHSVQPPLSLEELKSFLNIEEQFTTQDSLLNDLLNIATEYAEWYTEKSLMQREWRMVCIGQIPSKIYLLYGPVLKVMKVSRENGPDFSTDNYQVEDIGGYVEFYNVPDNSRISIEYLAGHTTTNDIPQTIKDGILHHVAAVYHKRDDNNYINHIKKLYSPFREVRLTL